jgi:hypothetical protein
MTINKFSLDKAECDNNIINVTGWVWQGASKINEKYRCFLVNDEAKVNVEIPLIRVLRPDVTSFLEISEEIYTGFSSYTSLENIKENPLIWRVNRVSIVDSTGIEIVSLPIIILYTDSIQNNIKRHKLHSIKSKLKSAFRLPQLKKVWCGDSINHRVKDNREIPLKDLLEKVQVIDEDRFSAVNDSIHNLARNIKSASEAHGVVVIFDHNYGGGSNVFSRRLTYNHLSKNNHVLRIFFDQEKKGFFGEYYTKDVKFSIVVGTSGNVFIFLSKLNFEILQINSIWTYQNIHHFIDSILRIKVDRPEMRIEFFVHDHMAICPSLFLLNDEGRFCNIPKSNNVCSHCLKNNKQEFKVFYGENSIKLWRKTWGSLLLNCELIRFFSSTTKEYFTKVYPWIESSNHAIIKPHKITTPAEKVYKLKRKRRQDALNIGVFGHIGFHKGSSVIKQVAQSIFDSHEQSKIFIFGSIEALSDLPKEIVINKGPYKQTEIAELCQKNEIDLVLIPSICPETFSLVCHELIAIQITIAAFNFGAQSECVKSYKKGFILDIDGKPVYDQIKFLGEDYE